MTKETMLTILKDVFQPTVIDVVDESHFHAGHNEDAKKGGTHFKVTIVSELFEGKRLVERHRMIYEALKKEEYHALAIHAKTQTEYSA